MGGYETQEQKVEKLIQQLKEALDSIGSEDAVPALIQLLQDKNQHEWVHSNVARALDSIGEGAVYVVSALILALQDQDAEVRRGMGIG